jgi:MFS family permease
MTLPFFVVYLHRVRGLDLGLATLALTALAVASFAGNIVGGSLSDRVGSRWALMLGLVVSSAGTAWFAFVDSAAAAVAAAAVIGLGVSISWPSLDALLASAVEPGQRSSVFAVRHATLNAGFGVGAVLAAAIVDFGSRGSFELLYLADAASFLAFLPVLLVVRGIGARAATGARVAGGYRVVLRDRAFLAVWVLTALVVAVAYAQYQASFPVYATGTGGITPRALGVAFAANTFGVVLLQFVVLRLLDGRRRTTAFVLGCVCFGLAWCITIAATHAGGSVSRTAVFAVAMVVLAAGETLLSPALSPIVNDLAPEALRGRYNGVFVLAFTTGFTAGPVLAGQGLRLGDGTPFFVILAGACGLAAAGGVLLRRLLDPRLDRVGTAPAETPVLGAEVV